MTYSSVALLVDGDNIAASFAGQILRKAKDLGPLNVRRVYGNLQSIPTWAEATSFRPVYSGTRKNASDILLSIEALELALARDIAAFAIATSDGDFCHIAHRLRELGRHVLGIVEEGASLNFIKACSEFHQLKPPVAAVADSDLNQTDKMVRSVLQKADPQRTGLLVARVNGLVRKKNPSFRISKHEDKNWQTYLSNRNKFYTVTGPPSERKVSIAAHQGEG